MKFSDRMQEVINKGVAGTKELLGKAGEKAKELGQKGAIKLDIFSLQAHAEKLIAKMGHEAYVAFTDKDQASVSRDAEPFAGLLKELDDLKARIEKKEADFKAVGGKEDALKPVD